MAESTSQVVGVAHEVLFASNECKHSQNDTDRKLDTILNLISNMDSRLNDKIDKVQSTLSALSIKVNQLEHELGNVKVKNSELEHKVRDMDIRSRECEKSAQSLSDMFDSVKVDVQANKVSVTDMQDSTFSEISTLRNNIDSLRKEKIQMNDELLDLRCRSMKNNLIFNGLLGEHKDENSESVLRDFLYNELGVDFQIEFGNVHRFGRFKQGKPRPIVARFLYYKDLIYVKNQAYKLRHSAYSINEQFPAEIENERRNLYPIRKQAKANGHATRLVRDKLYIDGKLHVPSSVPVPFEDSEETCVKRIDTYTNNNGPSYRDALVTTPTSRLPHSKRRRRNTSATANR